MFPFLLKRMICLYRKYFFRKSLYVLSSYSHFLSPAFILKWFLNKKKTSLCLEIVICKVWIGFNEVPWGAYWQRGSGVLGRASASSWPRLPGWGRGEEWGAAHQTEAAVTSQIDFHGWREIHETAIFPSMILKKIKNKKKIKLGYSLQK